MNEKILNIVTFGDNFILESYFRDLQFRFLDVVDDIFTMETKEELPGEQQQQQSRCNQPPLEETHTRQTLPPYLASRSPALMENYFWSVTATSFLIAMRRYF